MQLLQFLLLCESVEPFESNTELFPTLGKRFQVELEGKRFSFKLLLQLHDLFLSGLISM